MIFGYTVPGIIVPHISPISCHLMTSQKWQHKRCNDFHCIWQTLDQPPLICPWKGDPGDTLHSCLQSLLLVFSNHKALSRQDMSEGTLSSYTTFLDGGPSTISWLLSKWSHVSQQSNDLSVSPNQQLRSSTLKKRFGKRSGAWQTGQPNEAHFCSRWLPPHLSSCSGVAALKIQWIWV